MEMKSKLILVGLVLCVLILSGCVTTPEKTQVKYECKNGQLVEDRAKCPENRQTTTPTTVVAGAKIITILTTSPTTIKEVVVKPPKTYKIGETISGETLAVNVNSLVRKNILTKSTDLGFGEPYVQEYKPPAGKEFAIVDITVENIGNESAIASTFWNNQLQDSEGYTYTIDFMATGYLDKPFGGGTGGGEIIPGQKMRGEIPFLVDEGSKDLQLVFKFEMFGIGQAIIELE